MEQILCEPFELTESALDAVAGGSPFSTNSVSGTNNAFNGASFAIGAVLGDNSTASGIFAGQLNLFDIANHPTATIVNVVDNSINISGQ
jgi:hypothetical protein